MTWPQVVNNLVNDVFSWPVAIFLGIVIALKAAAWLVRTSLQPKSAAEALFGKREP
jgi:hypothetical protein